MHWRLCHEMVLYLLVLLHGVTLYHYVTTCPLLISGISSSPHDKIVWLLLRKSEKRYMHVSANLEYSNRILHIASTHFPVYLRQVAWRILRNFRRLSSQHICVSQLCACCGQTGLQRVSMPTAPALRFRIKSILTKSVGSQESRVLTLESDR